MSKVKSYMDVNKEKSLHRNRIDETRRTKANRIRKCKNGTYSFFRGGYYHETEHKSYRYTPTLAFGDEYDGKIIKTETWIDIDVGAGFGRQPVLLRLDDMKEFR